jgi:hypothetical protein
MGCRIQNILPPCSYNSEGIDEIRLLDFEDYIGVQFENDARYDVCKVLYVYGICSYVLVEATEAAKINSSLSGGIYTHTLESFVTNLSASLAANLNLASKRRYVVLFRTRSGNYFMFGSESGATISYTNQTEGGTGSLITLTAQSVFPLFELDSNIFNRPAPLPCTNFADIWNDDCIWNDLFRWQD